DLLHSIRETPESRRETRPASVDPQECRGTALLQGLESLARPPRRPAGQLRNQSISNAEGGGKRGQLGFGSQKPVGTTLDDKPVALLGNDHAPRPSFALEDRDVRACARQVPGGHESGDAGSHDDDSAHVQPRVRAAVRATSATAATRWASS